jgi:predicted RND superfamily exporter protein
MQLVGFDIDIVSLCAILLLVGCTVDYTSHVSYHYFAHQLSPAANMDESVRRLRFVVHVVFAGNIG